VMMLFVAIAMVSVCVWLQLMNSAPPGNRTGRCLGESIAALPLALPVG
jgi:hypothetical protein